MIFTVKTTPAWQEKLRKEYNDRLEQFSRDCRAGKVSIPIGQDGLCQCNCASICPLDHMGSMPRCSREQLESAGFTTKD